MSTATARHRPQHLGPGPHLLARRRSTCRCSPRSRCSSACSASAASATRASPTPQVFLNLLRRQRVPDRARGRDDLRDPHRRASTCRSARSWRCPRWSRPRTLRGRAGRRASRWSRCCSSAPLLGLLMGLLIHYFDIQPFIATLAGHVPGPRALLPDQRRVDPDPRRHVHRASRSATITLPGGYYIDLGRAAAPLAVVAVAAYVLHRDPLRPHGLRDRRQRELGAC